MSEGAVAIAAALCALGGALFVLAGFATLFTVRPLRAIGRSFAGLLLLLIAIALTAIVLGTAGYRALTHEELAARITVRPTGKQRFDATVALPDGPVQTYALAGDELNVEARVLKWKPFGNMLGLHTLYQLDRIGGRYSDVQDERRALRTVHSLNAPRPVDLFDLRRRFAQLAFLVDAEYGSGTFTTVSEPAELEIRVSATGLLVRGVAAPGPR